MIYAIAVIAGGYQLFALLACFAFFRKRRPPSPAAQPPASILKPIRGSDAGLLEAIRSNVEQDYPEFEVLCAVHAGDTAPREIPGARVIAAVTHAPNGKVGALIDLARAARHPILVLADADIRVPPDYLARVTAPLADPRVGLVTCLYRANGDSFPARFEALGISTDFAPSALVAPFAGVDEFAFGSTMVIRRADLEGIGGFQTIRDYLADDYQLGRRIRALHLKCVLSDVVVETHLAGTSWRAVWRHQLRWARTVRVSKPWGYAGLPVTFATFWAVVIAGLGNWPLAALLFGARMAMALAAGIAVMRDPNASRLAWLIPLRDLAAVVVWLAGCSGRTVVWRGERLRLSPDGRIIA